MSGARVVDLRTRLLHAPLQRPWAVDVRQVSVVEVRLRTEDGGEGWGFSWTPRIGGRAVQAVLEDDLAPWVRGRVLDEEAGAPWWRQAWEHLHEAGGGGVTTIALAGLDLAWWDLRARRAGLPLTDLLGRRHRRQPAYGSGVNLHYDLDDLLAQVQRWVDRGFTAVKIKVGGPRLAEDVQRVRAVRDLLGPDRALMVDANQRWDEETAVRAIAALEPFGLRWVEEPLRADDLPGHAGLRSRVGVPVAVGENVHTRYRFREWLDAGAVDVVQPNIVRVGGITPFLQVAELARERGVELAPHLLPELSAQVALALPEPTWVEDVEDAGFAASGVLSHPTGVRIDDGWAYVDPVVGLGMRFGERPAGADEEER